MNNFSFDGPENGKSKNIIEIFSNVDAEYSLDANRDYKSENDLVLERKIQRQAPTTEDITEMAKQSLASYKDEQTKEIQATYDNGMQKIETNKKAIEDDTEKSVNSTRSRFEIAKENLSNLMLKRGLGRSSIKEGGLGDLLDEKEAQIASAFSDLSQKIDKLSVTKTLLETQKQSALESFDIAYAVKLADKISSLTSQIEKEQQEVIEYNNKMAEKEAQNIIERSKADVNDAKLVLSQNEQLTDYISKYGQVGLNRLKQGVKLDRAISYFNTIGKNNAYNVLVNNQAVLKEALGNSFTNLVAHVENMEG